MTANKELPVPTESQKAQWTSFLTTLVLLGVGIASVFKLNFDRDALLALIPGAAFVAASIAAAVNAHGAHKVAIAQIMSQRAVTVGTNVNSAYHWPVLVGNVESTVSEDIHKAEQVVAQDALNLLSRTTDTLERVEARLQAFTDNSTPTPAQPPSAGTAAVVVSEVPPATE